MPQHTSTFSLLGHSSRAHGTFCKITNTKARTEHQPQQVPHRQQFALSEQCQGELPTTCTKLLKIQFSIHNVACYFWFGWPFLRMLYVIVFIHRMLLKTSFCSDFLYSQRLLPLYINTHKSIYIYIGVVCDPKKTGNQRLLWDQSNLVKWKVSLSMEGLRAGWL